MDHLKGHLKVPTEDGVFGEGRIMLRWKSSLWKLLWNELLIYTIMFMSISLIYRFALTEDQQLEFERLIRWGRNQNAGLPLTFLLGFYVNLVVKRWWEQFVKLPWPDDIAIFLAGLISTKESEEKVVMVRRTIVRYCMVAYIMCIRRISIRLRKRYPYVESLVRAGLITEDEAKRIGDENSNEIYGSNWWLPLKWSVDIVDDAKVEGHVVNGPQLVAVLQQIINFRSALQSVTTYGHITVPLVYTQVVTIAVYFYFLVALLGDQWIIPRNPGDEVDLWYPVLLSVKFLFYFGWLRVAETLYNPFGEDDDDFELNELVDRHFKVAMSIVTTKEKAPELSLDPYFSQEEPQLLEDYRDMCQITMKKKPAEPYRTKMERMDPM